MIELRTDVFTHEPDDIYHARARTGECLSSHKLAEFSKSPFRYWQSLQSDDDDEKPEYLFGRAAHCYILEGDKAFKDRFVVADGPVNPKTNMPFGKQSKAYLEWFAEQDKDVVSTEDFTMIAKMAASVRRHDFASKLIHNPTNVFEGVLRAMVDGAMCQIKADCFNPAMGIVDLKTCREIEFFQKDMRDFGYAYQLAFYRLVYKTATGNEPNCFIIAVDKTDASVAGVWRFPGPELDKYENRVRAKIRQWRQCVSTGIWPTGYEEPIIFEGELK